MTEEKIVKALECCTTIMDCHNCSYDNSKNCVCKLLENALDLIKCKNEMIEGLISGQETLQKYIKTAKAEAIKEFAERLKKYLLLPTAIEMSVVTASDIDNFVKEMVGADNG